jgi:SAM-dependent methyltransferase
MTDNTVEVRALDDVGLVRALRERSAANDSIVYAHRVYAETAALAARHGLVAPRAVLELGPGVNLGALFCFVASGARKAAGVDVAPLPAAPFSFYETLRDYVMAVEGFAWWRAWTTHSPSLASFPSVASFPDANKIFARIDFRSGITSEALPFGEMAFDLIYSVAALEHVADPRGTVAEMWRTLLPGGLAVHEIDLKHHGCADPLKFLEWDEVEWRGRARPYGADLSLEGILNGAFTGEVFCNRLRQSDWIAAFSEAGFNVEAVEPVIILDAAQVRPERFIPAFRSRPLDDLRTLAFRVVVRRPVDT